jgi:hypothetical protein
VQNTDLQGGKVRDLAKEIVKESAHRQGQHDLQFANGRQKKRLGVNVDPHPDEEHRKRHHDDVCATQSSKSNKNLPRQTTSEKKDET